MPTLQPLPIDPLLPQIRATFQEALTLVVEAEPGAGKTTRVPPALLSCVPEGQEIVVLEPRRLAARLAAARVAEERGEKLGEQVGYQVRFEEVAGPRTRIRFVTEGILTRRMISDPTLAKVGAVVIDEFHERHLAGDLALALVRRLQTTKRPELGLVVMSATLEAAPLRAYLGNCPALQSSGRRFEVQIDHLPAVDERPLEQQILGALKRALPLPAQGHILVFLPGAGEIQRTREACGDFAQRHGLEIHALHGELSAPEQDRAVRPSSRPKLILSTNVAESSVTIDGVVLVIDPGLARVAAHSPWSGLSQLKVAKVSQASAIQRAGRAGRTQAGRCLRLFTRADFEARPAHQVPEIKRLDLAETLLSVHAAGVRDAQAFPFFDPPEPSALKGAEQLLRRLGALTSSGEMSELGRRMLTLPTHPRQARVLLEGERRGVGRGAALMAALLGERDVRAESRVSFERRSGGTATTGPSDLLESAERFERVRGQRLSPERLRAAGLDPQASMAVERAFAQLSRTLREPEQALGAEARDRALLQSVLAGYPDRVAKRRRPHERELILCMGGSAELSEQSVVREAPLLVALDAEERGQRTGAKVMVRLASRIEPEWLIDLGEEALQETDQLEWSLQSERVERIQRLTYEALVIEESRSPAPPSPAASELLARQALAAGLETFAGEELGSFLARLAFAARSFPEVGLPAVGAEQLESLLRQACAGLTSFQELREAGLLHLLRAGLSSEQQRLLATLAPEAVTLPGGRRTTIHYEPDKPPWIASRLQDFFGLATGPAVGNGRIPLVLHLLAPNQRPVQVTTDLAGFWERHYPSIRKELCRKYPRHAWPDDPRHAAPPPPRRPR